MMEDFADEILRETAGLANRGKTPLSYRKLRERWRDAAERRRPASGTGFAHKNQTASTAGNSLQKSANQKPTAGRTGRGGAQLKGTTAKFGGNSVCFLFNSRKAGCPRTTKPGGCDDGRGSLYAHVCNFEMPNGSHCLAAHPRHANH